MPIGPRALASLQLACASTDTARSAE